MNDGGDRPPKLVATTRAMVQQFQRTLEVQSLYQSPPVLPHAAGTLQPPDPALKGTVRSDAKPDCSVHRQSGRTERGSRLARNLWPGGEGKVSSVQ